MISLPRELAPWSGLLGLFPEDLAGEVGRLLPRLALAMGSLRAARPVGGGEPDGFSGIVRRGSYERLLLTEWLLADEAPEEFSRRGAMGEHAFFHLARRSPVRAASSVAVFDTGPAQLGAPRIAQLAALIVLAERAERAGARFAWGVLGEPDKALVTEVTAQSVLGLLAARTAVAAGADDVAVWADRAAQRGWEDAWLVGRAGGGAWRHASLEIRDVLEPDRRALTVIARPPRAPPREIELLLPEPRASVRLLRDPFTVIAPAPRRRDVEHTPASNLVFAVNGTKLFARNASGEIIAFPVPNSSRDVTGRPKRYRPRTPGVVAAVGWVKRGLVMLVVTPREIVLEHTTTRGPALLDLSFLHGSVRIAVPRASDPLSPLVYREGLDDEALFLDARRALVRVRNAGPPHVDLLASEVSSLAASPTQVAFVGRTTEGSSARDTPRMGAQTLPPGAPPDLRGGFHLVHLASDTRRPSSQVLLLGDGTFEAAFGRDLTAVQQHGEEWTIHDNAGPPRVVKAPVDATVVGVHAAFPGSPPELVILEGDRRTVRASRASGRSFRPATSPIVDVTMNAWRGQLAYATAAGEVVIHSLFEDVPLGRYSPAS